jgi:hypothetical protein
MLVRTSRSFGDSWEKERVGNYLAGLEPSDVRVRDRVHEHGGHGARVGDSKDRQRGDRRLEPGATKSSGFSFSAI